MGVLGAGAAYALAGWGPLAAAMLGLAIWGAMLAAPLVASSLGGRAAGSLYSPSGRSTPRRREYSHAQSLAARGLYPEALAAFEVAISEDPADPEPYLRIARILRDRMGRHAAAAEAFKRALTVQGLPRGTRALVTRELVELYAGRLGEPTRAAPLLARLADEQSGTPEGDWAVEELKRVKELIAERGDLP